MEKILCGCEGNLSLAHDKRHLKSFPAILYSCPLCMLASSSIASLKLLIDTTLSDRVGHSLA